MSRSVTKNKEFFKDGLIVSRTYENSSLVIILTNEPKSLYNYPDKRG